MADDKTLNCQVHTPEGTVYDSEVNGVVLPGEEGQFGILYNHIPYMALLDAGPIRIEEADGTREMACGGGFAEIEDNKVIVLADTAEFPESIDRSEVEETIETLTERLKTGEGIDDAVERDEIKDNLKRAKVRLSVLEAAPP